MQAMPKAIQNSTFISFLKQYGLDLRSVEYVSAEYRPGACLPQILRFKICTTQVVTMAKNKSHTQGGIQERDSPDHTLAHPLCRANGGFYGHGDSSWTADGAHAAHCHKSFCVLLAEQFSVQAAPSPCSS